ncbi:leucyl aminopeptidase [Paenibacillus taihuensis]|uniref:Probable cytosol aminopeptidase n=1 Tax=Paenibacillus taihuensis TaxID=1156355 RepID=A0A3D9S0C9_9BACL|nr:leucyl aminopeptidase [Paenibacillus taihuensis]REE85178.1 leucyl aminopeptidase [Paenibacillus taihuensis]
MKQLIPAAVIGGGGSGVSSSAQAMTEGYALGLFVRKTAKKADAEAKRKSSVETVTFTPAQPPQDAGAAAAQWTAGIQRGVVFAESVIYARDVTNLPGNKLTPQALAEEAEKLAQKYNLDYEIFDEIAAAEEGMGGLLGVGQGSINPPRMVVIHYEGAPGKVDKWGLIGKGITFDTGGICIKPKLGMEEMISDMGGAASVLGVVRILGELRPAINAVIVIPTAENMPSDRAFKPGDVLTMMNGTTVEIVNTDAEGRLVLADGLTTAIRRGATKLIDVATLTGAVLVALGDVATGSVTNDDQLHEQVVAASKLAGERIWQLPAFPEFRRQLDCDAADMKNGGSRYGAASIAGLFIGAFTEDKPWVHLDIAGTAWLERDKVWEVKGATGVMVRTLGELFTQG